jgi:hypothetical protein
VHGGGNGDVNPLAQVSNLVVSGGEFLLEIVALATHTLNLTVQVAWGGLPAETCGSVD